MKTKIKRVWPILVSVGSTLTMIIVFLIPTLQDQWDRYQSQDIIREYIKLGDDFLDEEHYELAEQAYSKAFELSEEKRLDVEIKRLTARVGRMSIESSWGAEPPEGIEDIDFQFLLKFQQQRHLEHQRINTLNSYGIFLAAQQKLDDAALAFQEALELDSTNVLVLINYGNLLDQAEKKGQAEQYYKKALALEPGNLQAHYNLGLLYKEDNEMARAKMEFEEVYRLDTKYEDISNQLKAINAQQHGRTP